MSCISPVSLRRGEFVPCGKCNFCLARRRADWSFRLLQEQKGASSSSFLTLTYSDESLTFSDDGLPTLVKSDVQKFMKRLRKYQLECSSSRLRYYTVGEYGSVTQRPHYHSIMFNLAPEVLPLVPNIWGLGHVHVGDVTPASIHYCTGYVITSRVPQVGRAAEFALISNRSGGLGCSYLTEAVIGYHKTGRRKFVNVGKTKFAMPRYYAERVFSRRDRELMAAKWREEMGMKYWEEVEKLADFHTDPTRYYNELREFNHAALADKFSKSQSLKTI